MGSKPKAPPETAEEIALAEIARERRDYYEQNYRPLEEMFIHDTLSSEDDMMAQARDFANVDNRIAFGQVQPAVEAAQVRSGAGLGSGRFMDAVTGLGGDQASSRGLATSDALQSARNTAMNNYLSLVNVGRGVEGRAMQGMANVADVASRQAIIDARASAAARAAISQGIGTAAGYGLGGYMNRKAGSGLKESGVINNTGGIADGPYDIPQS